jgi:transcriptional regulator with XRE-family HTH domain
VDRAGKSDSLAWFRGNLKRARKAKGYSQEMLCEIAWIDLSHYGAVERGERTITIQKLFQITRALDIPMRHLFSGEPGRPSDEKEDKLERLIALLRGLDAGDLDVFDDILPRLVEWKSGD